MFERQQIEKLLTTHGIDPTAPDEKIKAVLITAEWNHDDIDAALYVLRDNKTTHKTHVDALHKIYRTDQRLQPETVKALLGIDMEITSEDIMHSKTRARGKITLGQIMNIALVSVTFSIIAFVFLMWFMKVGVFHQTAL